MSIKNIKILIIVLIATLTACSGGGGGGGGSSNSSSRNAKYGLRVLHAALDAAPLNVYSSLKPGQSLATVRFGLDSFYLGLPTGDQILSLFKGDNASAELLTQAVSINKDLKQTLLYYGNNAGLGIHSALLTDQVPMLEQGLSALRFIHACAGAQSLRFGVNDTVSAAFNELGADLQYGSASQYFNITSGILQLRAFRQADSKEIVSSAKALESGKAYTIVIMGQVDYLVLAQDYLDN